MMPSTPRWGACIAAALLGFLGSACAEPSKARAVERPTPQACLTRQEFNARTARSASDSEAAFVQALQAEGLRRVQLAAHTLRDVREEIRGPIAPAHVEERDVAGRGRVRVIVMPPTGGCGNLAAAFHFVQAGERIWLLEQHVTSHRVGVVLCACPDCICEKNKPRTGCGGARIAATTVLGYELPPGTDFAGTRIITSPEEDVFVEQALPPQPECVPEPPPP